MNEATERRERNASDERGAVIAKLLANPTELAVIGPKAAERAFRGLSAESRSSKRRKLAATVAGIKDKARELRLAAGEPAEPDGKSHVIATIHFTDEHDPLDTERWTTCTRCPFVATGDTNAEMATMWNGHPDAMSKRPRRIVATEDDEPVAAAGDAESDDEDDADEDDPAA